MTKQNKEEEIMEKIINKSVTEVLHDSMLPYAEYTILERAIPRVEDGLKPVQRRILYAMSHDLGLVPDKPHKKCARIVGEVLGKYHPHGDSSVYEALVNLAQNFKTNEVLVDGHGNFGSIDGDSAAAMRYTEARLSPLSLELLRDLEKNTVEWSLNFDDSLKEPSMLPGRFPNILVNGSQGIAVGVSTNIPSHNLNEAIDGVIAYIKNQNITLDELMEYIKGPDFPTGGFVVSDDNLREAYRTGRGKVTIHSRYTLEKENGKHRMIITEIPYTTSKKNILNALKEIKQDIKTKDTIYSNIQDISDESDMDGMRIVISFKKNAPAEKLAKAILSNKKICLINNFPINMVAIANGKPKQMSLIEIISEYTKAQRQLIIRRTQYDLEEAEKRIHILQGLIIGINNIEKVIKIVKSSKSTQDAKISLQEAFNLTEIQAQAILDMKLSRLAKLEVIKLEEEISTLEKAIKKYKAILRSIEKQYEVLIEELLEIKSRFKRSRRSQIISENSSMIKVIPQKDLDVKEKKEGIALLLQNGNIKVISNRAFQAGKTNGNIDELNAVKKIVETDNMNNLIAFTNKGNAIVFDIDYLPESKWNSKGSTIKEINKNTLSDEYCVALFDSREIKDKELIFATKNGYLKLSSSKEYLFDRFNYTAIGFKDENDELITVDIYNKDKWALFVTVNGIVLKCKLNNVPIQGIKATGVRGIKLNEEDFLLNCHFTDDEGELIIISKEGYGKKVIISLITESERDRKGIKCHSKQDTLIYSDTVKMPYNVIIKLPEEEKDIIISTEDIKISSLANSPRLPSNVNVKSSIYKVISNKIEDEIEF